MDANTTIAHLAFENYMKAYFLETILQRERVGRGQLILDTEEIFSQLFEAFKDLAPSCFISSYQMRKYYHRDKMNELFSYDHILFV